MCKFFSLVSDGKGKIMYFDSVIRKKILSKKLNYELDSHTSIADYYGYKGKDEDTLNKYEYNPLTKKFQVDMLNTIDDSKNVGRFCNELDFKTIVPELIIKPIINPFIDIKTETISDEDVRLLKQWASFRASVWDSVRGSVWDSVRDSVWDSIKNSTRASVWSSIRNYTRDSVWSSVWDSIRNSVGAYMSTFFDIKYKYDFSGCIKLWEKGLVPSFDGDTWRLHGFGGKILWEWKKY